MRRLLPVCLLALAAVLTAADVAAAGPLCRLVGRRHAARTTTTTTTTTTVRVRGVVGRRAVYPVYPAVIVTAPAAGGCATGGCASGKCPAAKPADPFARPVPVPKKK